MSRDFFEVLGVPRKFHLPTEELEKRYLALSKELHPDRFAKASPRERLTAVQKTTELNDAWRVLRDRVKRAEYLLKSEGLDVADEKNSVKASPALLGEMMELNEELSEASPAAVPGLVKRVESERAAALEGVDRKFGAYESGDRSVLPEIAQKLISLRYYDRFLERANGDEE
jgi:molecular chaperone HscB